MWNDDKDFFSIEALDSPFVKLDEWFRKSVVSASGMAPIVAGMALAIASSSVIPFSPGDAVSTTQSQGPPIPALSTSSQSLQSLSDLVVVDNGLSTNSGSELRDVADADTNLETKSGYRPTELNVELKKLQSLRDSLNQFVSINPKSVRVARIVAHQIESPVVPTIGFDDNGNVFLHFQNEHFDAYLTIERKAMHLFCKVPGRKNIYIDDEPFMGKRLPETIRNTLLGVMEA